ncbi:MAG TPA: carboxypeptidase-like regulatory domain-containing protein [Polyangiaceae bacterium]|nr:carboxypeptidase-like regulatory domain-containing protein [Polyangiaceae bacterium]
MNHAWKRPSFLVFLACVVSAGLTSACGGDTNTTVEDDPLVIDAYIEGTVIDGVTHAPIAGATVTVPGIAGSMNTFTTDSSGFYSLGVPGVGAHTLFIEADDYARAKYTVSAITEPGAAGNIRVTAVRNSVLYPKTGKLSGRVTSGGNRDVVAGASVLVQFTDTTDSIEDASITVTAKTGKAGEFSLSGLPAGAPQTRVSVLPVDLDKDKIPDTATFSALVTGGVGGGALTPDGENYMEISVDPFFSDKVLSTNLDDAATVAPEGPLLITYAQPMVDGLDATSVTLREGSIEVSVDVTWTSDTELSITPREPLLNGHSYSLAVQALSTAGVAVAFNRTFSVTSGDAPADATAVEIMDPDPIAWNAKSFTLAFDAVTGADGYRILARNNQRQTSWLVLFEGVVSQFDRPQVRVTLPDGFDTFPSEDAFSAVGFGTSVDFAVQAFSGKNDGPFPDATQFATLSDTHCPRLNVVSQGSSDNTLGTEEIRAKYLLTSEGGEPLADGPVPKFTFAAGAGAADTVVLVAKTMQVRRLRADQFEVSFAVPAGVSGALDTVTADLSKVKDTSGNVPDGTPLCPKTLTFTSN